MIYSKTKTITFTIDELHELRYATDKAYQSALIYFGSLEDCPVLNHLEAIRDKIAMALS